MTKVNNRVGSELRSLQASLMKVRLLRSIVNLMLALVNVSREFYTARMILLSSDKPARHKVRHT